MNSGFTRYHALCPADVYRADTDGLDMTAACSAQGCNALEGDNGACFYLGLDWKCAHSSLSSHKVCGLKLSSVYLTSVWLWHCIGNLHRHSIRMKDATVCSTWTVCLTCHGAPQISLMRYQDNFLIFKSLLSNHILNAHTIGDKGSVLPENSVN